MTPAAFVRMLNIRKMNKKLVLNTVWNHSLLLNMENKPPFTSNIFMQCQHLKTALLRKYVDYKNQSEIPNCLKRQSNGHSFC